MPTLALALGTLTSSVAAALFWRHSKRSEPAAPRCGRCGYPVVGLSSERCPECGSFFAEVGVDVPRGVAWWINAGLLALNVLLNLALIPPLGALGAALVTLATALLYTLAQKITLRRSGPAAAVPEPQPLHASCD